MVDLHSHILPGIDDGAKDVDVAIELLKMARVQGIDKIVCTPHYDAQKGSVPSFLRYRLKSSKLLRREMKQQEILCELKMGAEVYLTEEASCVDLLPLRIEGTDYLLVEFPVIASGNGLLELLYEVQLQGVIPIIAHIERYPFAAENPEFILELIRMGCVIQVNATTILRKDKYARWILPFIKCGLIQIVASDVHSIKNRPCKMDKATKRIRKKCGKAVCGRMEQMASRIYHGELVETNEIKVPRKILGSWRG